MIDKPVYVLLPGKSINRLKDRIETFKDYDVLWAGVNRIDLLEQDFLSKINKTFNIWFYSATEDLLDYADAIHKFQGTFITSHEAQNIIKKKDAIVTSMGYGLISLVPLLYALDKLGVKFVRLFGADGDGFYYRPDFSKKSKNEVSKAREADTLAMNSVFCVLYRLWGMSIKIINHSMGSRYNCFDKEQLP